MKGPIKTITRPEPWSPAELKRTGDILDAMQIPFGWELVAQYDGGTVTLQVQAPAGEDNRTGAPMAWRGRKWFLSRHMTAGEIAQTVLAAVLMAAEHEIRETVTYMGESVFDPHYDLAKLVEFRARPDVIKGRD